MMMMMMKNRIRIHNTCIIFTKDAATQCFNHLNMNCLTVADSLSLFTFLKMNFAWVGLKTVTMNGVTSKVELLLYVTPLDKIMRHTLHN